MSLSQIDLSKKLPSMQLFLAKPSKNIIGKVDGYVFNVLSSVKSKEPNNLKFDMAYKITKDHALIDNKYISKIFEGYLIKTVYNGSTEWYKIQNITKSGQDKDILSITANSLEIELNGKKVINLDETSINCETALVLGLSDTYSSETAEASTTSTVVNVTNHGLVTNDYVSNVTRNALRKVTYIDANSFSVDSVTSQTSGDELVLYKNATKWTIGSIDSSYNTMYRKFQSDFDGLLDYIQNTIVTTFTNSEAVFDTDARTISIVTEASLETDMGYRVKFGQHMIGVSEDSDATKVITRVYPRGKDNLTVTRVNPTGREYIDNFSNYMTTDYMSSSLISSLNSYNTLLSSKAPISDTAETGTTETNITMISHGLSNNDYIVNSSRSRATRSVTVVDSDNVTVDTITDMTVSDNILKYKSGTFGYLLFGLEDLQASLLTKGNELNALILEKTVILDLITAQTSALTIDTYSTVITNTTLTRTLSGLDTGDFYVAMARISTTTGTTASVDSSSESFVADTWSVLAKINSGLTSHSIAITTTQTNVSVRIMILKITSSEFSTSSNEAALIDKYCDDAKQVEIDVKQAEIDTINASITSKNADIATLQDELLYESNFTPSELDELKDYTFMGEFRDENIVGDKDLYDEAVADQLKNCIPQILYKVDVVDFEHSITEQRNWKKLNLNSLIYVQNDNIGIDIQTKLLEIERNFEDSKINLVIGNSKDILSNDDKFLKAIYKSIKTTNTIATNKSGYDNTKSNFNTRNDRISTVPATPVIESDSTAIEHTLNSDGSANITFTWGFTGSGNSYDIDGFYVYTHSSSSDNFYTFGSIESKNDHVNTYKADQRSIKMYGVAANDYYTFGVQAYRIVDADVDSSGELKSAIMQPSLYTENPYQPSSSVNYTGDIDGTSASTVVTQASNSVQLDTSYNNVVINETDGINVIDSNTKSKTIMNSGGFKVQKNTGTASTPVWEDQLSADSNGNLSVNGSITSLATITGGSIQTDTSGERIVLSSSDNLLIAYLDANNYLSIIPNLLGSPVIQLTSNGSVAGYIGLNGAGDLAIFTSGSSDLLIQTSNFFRISGGWAHFKDDTTGNTLATDLSGKSNVGSTTSGTAVSDSHDHGLNSFDYIQCYTSGGVATTLKQWNPYAGSASHTHTTT